MYLSRVFSAAIDGIEAKLIEIETDVHVGLHSFNIVGLADRSLSEAKERVSSALKNSGVKPPTKENRKIVVNLAPADLKKTGSQYDLAIAVGYLLATGQIKNFDSSKKIFVGELALEGSLRSVNGVLNIVRMAQKKGFKEVFVPKENAVEAAIIDGAQVIPVVNLSELMAHLEGRTVIASQPRTDMRPATPQGHYLTDIADIKGQENAKRALMIAAAGGHNLFMQGTPGAGKTMLAQALASILPAPDYEEIIEITQIYSAARLLKENSFIDWRPFRAPHHTASPVSVIGGGQNPKPGEISLAHRGVLFLDEVAEFRRDVLEALRQPIESGSITVSRVKDTVRFPAEFIFVAAMNPCPCGYYGDDSSSGGKECRCSAFEVFRYKKKISGPLLDRIDLQIMVPRVKIEALQNKNRDYEQAEQTRQKVLSVRAIQKERFRKMGLGIMTNAEMNSKACDEIITLDKEGNQFLKDIFGKSLISARGYYRLLKTGRTIADLENSEQVKMSHLAEAFQYRLRDADSL